MSKYRFVLLGLQGRVVDGLLQDCIDDLDALDKARAMSTHRAVEIWHGGRHVAMVKLGDAPLNAQDRVSL